MIGMTSFNDQHPRSTAGRFADKSGSGPEATLPLPVGQHFPETQRDARGHDFYPADFGDWPELYAHEDTPMAELPLYAHYLTGDTHFYVSEVDPDTGEAFVYTDYGHGIDGGFGYLPITEMEALIVTSGHGGEPLQRDQDFAAGTLAKQVISKYI